MSIVIINPGDSVVSADVESSWESVQDSINEQYTPSIRRDALNRNHLPPLRAELASGTHRPRQFTGTTTPVAVSSAYVTTGNTDIVAHWQNVLTLNSDGAAGWNLKHTYMVIMASVFVDTFAAASTNNAALMAVTVSVNGAAHAKIHASDFRFVQGEDNTALTDGLEVTDKVAHLWTIYEKTSNAVLTSVKLWVAKNNQDWTMDRATLGLYGFYNGN